MGKRLSSQAGFTLLELLVVMVIFSFIALGAHSMLRAVLESHETVQRHADDLMNLQKIVRLMEQDIRQMEPQSAALNSSPYIFRFVRHGWGNPLSLPRSDKVVVAYGLRGDTLERYYWPPGGGDDVSPIAQPLLNHVSGLAFQSPEPHLMAVTFSHAYFGDIRRVIEVTPP